MVNILPERVLDVAIKICLYAKECNDGKEIVSYCRKMLSKKKFLPMIFERRGKVLIFMLLKFLKQLPDAALWAPMSATIKSKLC